MKSISLFPTGSSADSGSSGFGAPSSFGNQAGPSAPGLVQPQSSFGNQNGPSAPGLAQPQSSFGGQQNNFGQTGGNTQCKLSKKMRYSIFQF